MARYKVKKGPNYKHLSWNIHQDQETGTITKSQRDYLMEVVTASGVTKEHNLASRANLLDVNPESIKLSEPEIGRFRSTLQKVAYARDGMLSTE